jgi:outer membrane protein assembly factor BamB
MNATHEIVPMILPTVMIPLTVVSVALSVFASLIASLFGIQLKLEGPRKLFEVLLKPRVLFTSLLVNLVILGGVRGVIWWKNYPRLLRTIKHESLIRAKSSNVNFTDVSAVPTNFKESSSVAREISGIKQIWKNETGYGSFRAPVFSSGKIFFGNDEGIIRELSLTTGEEGRSFYIGTAASSELTLWNNYLFAGEGVHDTHHARFYRFSLKTGKFESSFQTKGHTEAQAVIGTYSGQSLLFIPSGSDGLHAVDPITMTERWSLNLGHMDAGVLVEENIIFIGTGREKDDDKKNKCYSAALDFLSGKILWQQELAASSWMRPVSYGENVCYIQGEVYFPSARGHVACFNKRTGEHTFGFNTSDPLAATPKIVNDSLLYTSIYGKVCRFNLKNRVHEWCYDTRQKETKSYAGASYDPSTQTVLYPSMKDGLFVLNAKSGKLIFNWKPSQEEGEWRKIYADVTVAGGVWVLVDAEGGIRALRPLFELQTAKTPQKNTGENSKDMGKKS